LHGSSPLAAWAAGNQVALIRAVAASHTIHGALLLALRHETGMVFDSTTLIVGGLGYAMIYLLAASGLRSGWQRLTAPALYYVWAVFAVTSINNTAAKPLAGLFGAACVVALYKRLRPA
jgi:hypothetical protein